MVASSCQTTPAISHHVTIYILPSCLIHILALQALNPLYFNCINTMSYNSKATEPGPSYQVNSYQATSIRDLDTAAA